MTRPKSVALAFLVGAFLVGGLLGFTMDRLIVRNQVCDQGSMRTRLAEDLSLTSQQRAVVDSVLDLRNARMDVVTEPLRPQLDSLMWQARDDIRAILTPTQRAKYEEKIRESDARSLPPSQPRGSP